METFFDLCFDELKEKYKRWLVVLCTVPQNPEVGRLVANFMNKNVNK